MFIWFPLQLFITSWQTGDSKCILQRCQYILSCEFQTGSILHIHWLKKNLKKEEEKKKADMSRKVHFEGFQHSFAQGITTSTLRDGEREWWRKTSDEDEEWIPNQREHSEETYSVKARREVWAKSRAKNKCLSMDLYCKLHNDIYLMWRFPFDRFFRTVLL